MPLTNREAHWVNVLARHHGARARHDDRPAPTSPEVEEALAGLADHAFAKLLAGVTGTDVHRAFAERTTAAA